MPICPNCNEKINKGTANKIKIRGVWVHKECPKKRAKRIREKKRLVATEDTH